MSNDEDGQMTIEWLIRNKIKEKRIASSISAKYTNWEPREAFRELVQNWRDSIIERFDIEERNFHVIRRNEEPGSRDIVYSVFHIPPGSSEKKCVGYIRYAGMEGTVDISNRNAALEPYHISMGESTKKKNSRQAGEHGDGLIIAILTLMRSPMNCSVRCLSCGFRWTFNFTKTGLLHITVRELSVLALDDHARRVSELPFAVDPHEDVRFMLGERLYGRGDDGQAVHRRRISRDEFEAWTKAALFLDRELSSVNTSAPTLTPTTTVYPPRVVTDDGDLLISEHLRGCFYLKGLLLRESLPARSASSTNLPLRFGYNFYHGTTNRDRLLVGTADEESGRILDIWTKVLEVRKDLVKELSDMLNTEAPRYADVAWAEVCEDRPMLKTLRDYLISTPHENRWYYSTDDKAKNPRLAHIIRGLGRAGFELTNTYWRMLSAQGLLHTAEEEERLRFIAAPRMNAMPCTFFAARLERLLHACMRACPATEDVVIRFARAGDLSLQLFFNLDERLMLIHERWLSIEGAAQELGLPETMPEQWILDSATRQLFCEAIRQLPHTAFKQLQPQSEQPIHGRTSTWFQNFEITRMGMRLASYMFAQPFGAKPTGNRKMRVSWNAGPLEGDSSPVEVHCHRVATCFHLRNSLFLAEDAQVGKLVCLQQAPLEAGEAIRLGASSCLVRPVGKSKYWDVELDEGEEYFFVLVTAPVDPHSILVLSDVVRMTSPTAPLLSPIAAPANTPAVDLTDDLLMSGISVPSPLLPAFAPDIPICCYSNRLANRDIVLDVGKNWHEGIDCHGRRVVIGILPAEAPLTGNKQPGIDDAVV